LEKIRKRDLLVKLRTKAQMLNLNARKADSRRTEKGSSQSPCMIRIHRGVNEESIAKQKPTLLERDAFLHLIRTIPTMVSAKLAFELKSQKGVFRPVPEEL